MMPPDTPGPRPRTSAHDLAAATPETRNRYLDLLRVVSIGVVVLGHWLMAALGFEDGKFTGSNLLELDPSRPILTWGFQVMPLFFIVGGFTNAISWESARRRGTSYTDWLHAKAHRLVRPALWFVGFWTVLPLVAVTVGLLPASVARVGGQEVALPLWFLAAYLLAVALVPVLHVVHERIGAWTLAWLVAGTLLVDVIWYGLDFGKVGAANFVFVWAAMLELGILWREGTLRRLRWLPWAMAGGGLAAMAVLTTLFDYPVSMIDLTHSPRSNAQPPTLALLALGVWQCGAMLLFEDRANRWLTKKRPWLAVVIANSMVMTFYLWNMSAVVLAAVLLFPTGIAPQPEALSAAWWWLRPAWVLACAICILPFLFGFRWAERPGGSPARARSTEPLLVGTVAAAAGFALLALHAFPVPGEQALLPSVGAGLVLVGAVAAGVRPLPEHTAK